MLSKPIDYPKYLKTPHWKKKKRELYKYREGRCQDCGKFSFYETNFDGHHLTYETLYHENVKRDLALLCNEFGNGCHFRRHRFTKDRGSLRPSDIFALIKNWWSR